MKERGLKTREPRKNEDPRSEVRSRTADIGRRLIGLLRYIPILGYFLYWDRKESLRRSLRVGALSVLSFSLVSLWAEVVAEVAGAHSITAAIESYELKWPVVLLFSGSVLLLLFYHARERRYHRPQHYLGEKVWEFFEKRPYKSEAALINTALQLFHSVFGAFGIAHVSIFRAEEDVLRIRGNEVYPEEADRGYFEPLRVGQGVAGLVYQDMNPRYVPRLFFPWNRRSAASTFFPHSMKFEVAGTVQGSITLVNPKMDLYVFQAPQQGSLRFRSFLSVPLRCAPTASSHGQCLGVLNFDFHATDPLSKLDIKSAVFLGALLGEEIERFHGSGNA